MVATHRIKSKNGATLGFIVDMEYYSYNKTKESIKFIENLSLLSNGVIRARTKLPIIKYTDTNNEKEYEDLSKENTFVRDIQNDLESWKNRGTKRIFQLDGTRGVGKTTEVLKFAYKNYKNVLYFNLAIQRDLRLLLKLVENDITQLKMDEICKAKNTEPYDNARKTILILDEIQISPTIYNKLRNMRSSLKCDIIIIGDYLDSTIVCSDGRYMSLSSVERYTMFPLSFREFCRVFNVEDKLMGMDIFGGSQDTADKLYKIYEIYLQIGGYPEVVKEYLATKDINACYSILDDILDTFRRECNTYLAKYTDYTLEIPSTLFHRLVYEMCNAKNTCSIDKIKRIATNIKDSTNALVSGKEISRITTWIKHSGIVGSCNLVVEGNIQNIQNDRKIYYTDCGIASLLANKAHIAISNTRGMITETFVYAELHRLCKVRDANKLVCEDEVCFSTYREYELDFLVSTRDKKIYGIEVKTESGRCRSLQCYTDKKLVDRAIIARHSRGGHGKSSDTIPIFTVGARFPYIDSID